VGSEKVTEAYNDKDFIIGNKVPDMLADCYEKRNVSQFAVTSNFSISELLEKGNNYDDRIISRCKGMFFEIEFPSVDFREG
jgi:DNA replication protein DnaC